MYQNPFNITQLHGITLIQASTNDTNLQWTTTTNQKQAWCVMPGCSCHYTYGRNNKPHEASPFPPYLNSTLQSMNDLVATNHDGLYSYKGATYNGCNITLYLDPEDNLGWHDDNDDLFNTNTTSPSDFKSIASFSIGSPRQFQFKHKTTNQQHNTTLHNGSVVIMEKATQNNYVHRIPATQFNDDNFHNIRIALTFRHITPNCHRHT